MRHKKMKVSPKNNRPSCPPTATAAAAAPTQSLLQAFKTLFTCWPMWMGAGYDRIFSLSLTLWYMVYQRLQADHTLDHVLADIHSGGADRLSQPGRKPLSQRILSCATTAYSNARQRLSLSVITGAQQWLVGHLLPLEQSLYHGWRVLLMDGTTFRLRPLGNIFKAFGSQRNQHSKKHHPAYWCLVRVVGCFCAHTGLLVDSHSGHTRLSEPALICRLMLRNQAKKFLYVGDRAYGIFRVVQTARAAGAALLVRLTQLRAFKVAGKPLHRRGTYPVLWTPSRHDQGQPNCSTEPVQGRLLVARVHRKGFRPEVLYLFTTLTDTTRYTDAQLLELYGGRWRVELNFRYVKAQLEMDQFECYSARMALKEWQAGLLAYNLIRLVMYQAACVHDREPDKLSFSGSRRVLVQWLADFGSHSGPRLDRWLKLLSQVARKRLPKRSKPRPHEPRLKRHLRETFPPLRGPRDLARKILRHASPKY
jgi:hypothetical protein